MNTPRSRRSRASVCYKEDSFVEDNSPKKENKKQNREKTQSKANKSDIKWYDDGSFHLSDESMCHSEAEENNEASEIAMDESKQPDDYKLMTESICMQPSVVSKDLETTDSPRRGRPKKKDNNSPTRVESKTVDEAVTPRRGIRMRRKTELAILAEESTKRSHRVEEVVDSSDDDMSVDAPEKPTELFTEDDVEGKKMFGFKMSHRKKNLLKKAIETALESPLRNLSLKTSNTPKSQSNPTTPKRKGRPPKNLSTPKSSNITPANTPKTVKSALIPKTPHRIRNKMKKELQTLILSEEEGTDFSDSGSEFCASSEESDDTIESDNDNCESNSSSDTESINKRIPEEKVTTKSYSLRQRGEKDDNFIVKSDNYFTSRGSKKIITSNRTLDRLKNPRMTEDKLIDILKNHTISKEHKCAIKELVEDHEKLFDKWTFVLSEGFSVLLHGVGSKMKLIEDFQRVKLVNNPCLVINGFFPSLTLKDVLDAIVLDVLELSSVPGNVNEALDLITEEMSDRSDAHFFLLVHNIDGPMLRNNKMQHVLSKLARIPNVHVVASLDHINGPLYWDHIKLHDFNFSWWDVTTFLPYTNETSFESSLMINKSGALALSSMQNVFHSLTTNAKGIFKIIVNYQLKNKKTPHYQGISFKELYWSAREGFLVSSDLALRAQLTEFLDHKLIRNKRTLDGVENLLIPIDNNLLQQFVDQSEEC